MEGPGHGLVPGARLAAPVRPLRHHCLLEVFQAGALCAKAPEAPLGGWCRGRAAGSSRSARSSPWGASHPENAPTLLPWTPAQTCSPPHSSVLRQGACMPSARCSGHPRPTGVLEEGVRRRWQRGPETGGPGPKASGCPPGADLQLAPASVWGEDCERRLRPHPLPAAAHSSEA